MITAVLVVAITDNGIIMIYTQDILDRKTGELISVSAGDWITIREFAEFLSYGHRQTIVILREMGFLQLEGTGKNSRHRVADWLVAMGWAKRHHTKADHYPFDVINTDAVFWVIDRWEQARADYLQSTCTADVEQAQRALQAFQINRDRRDMSVQMQVSWLVDHFPKLTQEMIAGVVAVTQQVVSKFLIARSNYIKEAKRLKAKTFI